MTEIVFGSCNHLFGKPQSRKISHNLIKIYPEETKVDVHILCSQNEIPVTSTIIYGAAPPKRPPRLKKAKQVQDEKISDEIQLLQQISFDGNGSLCCLPKCLIQKKNGDDKVKSNPD